MYGWLRLIEKSGDFSIGFFRRDNVEESLTFLTLWYSMVRGEITSPFRLSGLAAGNWMSGHAPFICRRQDLRSPPRERVNTDEGEGAARLLHFLDHGDDLHDDLVNGYIELGGKYFSGDGSREVVLVRLPDDHPALAFEGEDILLVISFSEPAHAFSRPAELEDMKKLIHEASTDRQKSGLQMDVRNLRAMMRADERWLRLHVPARLELQAARLVDHAWHEIEKEHVPDLFRPLTETREEGRRLFRVARTADRRFPVSPTDLRIGLNHYRKKAVRQRNEAWAAAMSALAEKLAGRLEQIRLEGEDLVEWRKYQLQQEEGKKPPGSDPGQQNMWRGRVAAARRRVKMAELVLAARTNALKAACNAVASGDVQPGQQWHLVARFVR